MIRAVLFLVVLVVLSVAAAWVADNPGTVTLQWQGFRVDSSVAVALAALLALIVIVLLAAKLIGAILRGPGGIRQFFADRRRRHGFEAMTEGLVAAAAGDARTARKLAKRSQRMMKDEPLTLVLSAQAAQLADDRTAATGYFTEMLEHDETEFLGLRGLLAQAMRDGNWSRALELARRANGLKPGTRWVVNTLFDLQTRLGEWAEAEATVLAAERYNLLDRGEARRRRAVLKTEAARAQGQSGLFEDGLRDAREAIKLAPDLTAASIVAAQLALEAGHERRARKLVEDAWARAPHPELAALYARAAGSAPLDRAKQLEQLVKIAPDSAESHLALAEAALAAEIFGVARNHLDQAAEHGAGHRLYRLKAMLTERDNGDIEAARGWWRRAAEAPADPSWICASCGTAHDAWHALCAKCNAFDKLEWRTPSALPTVVAVEVGAPPATATQHEQEAAVAGESKSDAFKRGSAAEDAARQ